MSSRPLTIIKLRTKISHHNLSRAPYHAILTCSDIVALSMSLDSCPHWAAPEKAWIAAALSSEVLYISNSGIIRHADCMLVLRSSSSTRTEV